MTTQHTQQLTLKDYPLQAHDKLRYSDTDRQGHINNAVFSTFLETGRVELLCSPEEPLLPDNASFVIARLNLQLLAEMHWPGTVEIGSAITQIGNSSIHLTQSLFQNGICTATAETVIVQVDNTTHRSCPLTDSARAILASYQLKQAD